MARFLSLTSQSQPPKPPLNPFNPVTSHLSEESTSRRAFSFNTGVLSLVALIQPPTLFAQTSTSSTKTILSGITSTKSWFRFFGDGFAIRVPPDFEDIMEPEDYNAGLSLYGDKAKPKTFAARFATPDGSEVLSVVVRPSNQLKITFLEAKDVSDLGSLKEAKKIFVPGMCACACARNNNNQALIPNKFGAGYMDSSSPLMNSILHSFGKITFLNEKFRWNMG